jgi:DNA-binding NarL/FixJ family response regulator
MDVILVDAHFVTYLGIKEMFGLVKGHDFVLKQSFTSSKDFLNQMHGNEANLIILSLFIGEMDTFDLITYLRAMCSKTKIVLFTSVFNQEIILKAIKSGANGIISKTANSNSFINGLQNVVTNNRFTCIGVEENPKTHFKKREDLDKHKLTKREREILSLIKEGIKNKEISVILNISLSTVEFHRKNLYLKYEVSNVAGLFAKVND